MSALLLAVALLSPGLRAQDGWDARLTKYEGTVSVYTGGSEDSSEPETDMPLEAGDRIVTGADGRAEVALESESLVEIGPRSAFTMESLDAKDSWISLQLGTLSAKLKSLLPGRSLRVRTPTAVAAVRGTEFAVEVPDEGETRVGVFDEGVVSVESGTEAVELQPNQETQVLRGKSPLRPAALKRIAHMRARMQKLRARREAVRRAWKALSPEKRRELRGAFMERRRERIQKLKERGGELRERRQQRREELREKGQQRREELREKGRDLRQQMRERRQDRPGAGGPQDGSRAPGAGPRQGQDRRQGAQGQRQDRRRPGGRENR